MQHTFLFISLPLFCTTTTWNFQKLPSNKWKKCRMCPYSLSSHCRSFSRKKERLGFTVVVFLSLRPRPNVELFMRRTKLSESISWKFRLMAQLISSQEWVWIVQHVLSVSASDGQKLIDFHMRRTKLINLKISPCFCCFNAVVILFVFMLRVVLLAYLSSFHFIIIIVIIIIILRQGLQQVY